MANKVEINTTAPDFALDDFRGQTVRLSDYQSKRHVVLVFNRGFT
jgi:peroxiredoxin